MREFRRQLEEVCGAELVGVLERALRDEDVRVALEAFKLASAYLYGRPGVLDLHDIAEPTEVPPLEDVRRALDRVPTEDLYRAVEGADR